MKPVSIQKFSLTDLEAHLTGFWLTDLANFSSYVYQTFGDLNWVGFYLSDGSKLRLGPFCGNPACTEIAFGKGVCGTSFSKNETLVVDDVDAFPGHIRCDSASRSEVVVPFKVNGKLVGVLDVDSPTHARFSQDDRVQIEKALNLLSEKLSAFQSKTGLLI